MKELSPEIIENKLRNLMTIDSIDIKDLRGGDHWELVIVSPDFKGLSRIQQHQKIYEALEDFMKDDSIHALKLKTKVSEN